jgi:tRNA nucleotidyltransferase/poly(A) polymerase
MEALNILNKLSAITKLQEVGGEIFLVGGIVRDHFLKKASKDIDIVVRNVEESVIKEILESCGKLASEDGDGKTGSSFGVFKFFPSEVRLDEAIDIALPRTERLMTDKEFSEAVLAGDLKSHNRHKAFVVDSDPFLSIEDDLKRRDFTINAMAMSLEGDLIDPFNGCMSLASGKLEHVSDQAFSDDPLRMLRGIQFASRFDFGFVDSTWNMIQENCADIKHITGERILTELDKVFTKGNKLQGLLLLKDSGLADEIFPNFNLSELHRVPLCVTREDFVSFLVKDGDEFKKILKGDVDTAKGVDAINIVRDGVLNVSNGTPDGLETSFKGTLRHIIFNAQKKSSTVLVSGLLHDNPTLSNIANEFVSGTMPKTVNELALNGKDLMELGLIGKAIGDGQQLMLNSVFAEELVNTRESLESLF